MELNKIYNKLLSLENDSHSVFIARKIDDNKNGVRLAIDIDKNPTLLIPEENFEENEFSMSNYKLNYLEINFNQLCRINDISEN